MMIEEGFFGSLESGHGSYTVFQDESGVSPANQWLIIGLLFVQTARVVSLEAALARTKAECGCDHEIHFTQLPAQCGTGYGARSRTALRWMREYRSSWYEHAAFTALAIDTRALSSASFPTRFYTQNRFCVEALKMGIAIHVIPCGYNTLALQIVYDRHDLPSLDKTGLEDNYDQYVGPRLEKAIQEKGVTAGGRLYPSVSVSSVQPADSCSCLPLQLTDLLLGAVNQAVTHGARQRTKNNLGLAMAHWCMDASKSPWLQQLGMYRKLNLKAFPDENGKMYDLVNVVQEDPDDTDLFG